MYCQKCGYQNADGSQFCKSCGTQFSAPIRQGQGINNFIPNRPPPRPDQQFNVGSISDHKGLAVLSIFIGLFIPGAIAFYYSSQVNKHLSVGNYPAAVEASNAAKTWAIAGIVIGVIVWYSIINSNSGYY